MAISEGARVRVISRPVTDEDRKSQRYYEHMAGLVGTVENVYGDDDVAVRVDEETLPEATRVVHLEAGRRLRERFQHEVSEEAKSGLTPEELNFRPTFVILARQRDLEPI